ncbi:MAG: PilT/PilU family type 4a pilus ATPase [Akkermansiaceae bacterium]
MPSIDELAQQAFAAGAIDLFLREGQSPRMRLQGEVGEAEGEAIERQTLADFWLKCGADPEVDLERDVSYIIPGGRRLRVNLYHSLGLLAAVMRPIEEEIPNFEQLGLPTELFETWLKRRAGLVLVTGPTGSGKSTTLASCLQWINQRYTQHIVTIEDPVEYLFHNDKCYFSQREVRADTESFSSALRSSLRQSPDVILLGEIRDEESALISLQAAETGHLVLATLHSSGVIDTMERLTNLFSEGHRESAVMLLSLHLIGIFSQQLLPRKGDGLFLAVEHLHNEAATRKWIKERKYPELLDLMHRGDSPLNCSFLRYLVAATNQGLIEKEVARSAAPNPQDFDRAMKGIY